MRRARLRVKELAQAKGWNISNLSVESRLSYSQTHRIWHDNVTQLDFSTLEKLARALGVQVGDLFVENATGTKSEYNDENSKTRTRVAA